MRRGLWLAAGALFCSLTHHAAAQGTKPAPPADVVIVPGKELYRLRVFNQMGGVVELSSDGGGVWEPLGKVTKAATAVNAASEVITIAPPGTVSGVTPESLTLRIPPGKTGHRSLRILARGESEAAGAISTDIPARGSLFRTIAPPVGSSALIERQGGKLEPLPAGYVPRNGDRLVMLVAPPRVMESATITIENKPGGEVVVSSPNGAARVIAKVKQPLRGIGRYAGTERAGSGAVISWTSTSVVVSTAGKLRKGDDKQMPEERGGFVIQPAEPALRGTTHPASQLLIEAVPDGETKPSVSPFFALPTPLSNGDPMDPQPTRVEVRIDGQPWESCPDLRGTVDAEALPAAVQAALGKERPAVREGITHIRFVYGQVTDAGLQRRLRLALTPAAEQIQRGSVSISANVMGAGIAFVQFFLNGNLVQLTNRPPYTWQWDTTAVPNGEHLVEIRGLDDKLARVTSVVTKVIVDN
jgi:hypothetical protein